MRRRPRPTEAAGVIGPAAIAAEHAAALLRDPEILGEYEAGLFDPTPAVAAALDERLRRLRGYGDADVSLVGDADERG